MCGVSTIITDDKKMKKQLQKTILIAILAIVSLSNIANAQYTKVLDFASATIGVFPNADLISDGTFLYGMTVNGGANFMGTIFKIKPDGTGYATLLDFDGTSKGRSPRGSLISDGTFLYGMTEGGGTNDVGTIFKIMPNGTGYLKLLDFSGTVNGSAPVGSLKYDGTFLYGMTFQGGTNTFGTIFKIKPDGTGYIKLLDFVDNNINNLKGRFPSGSLISDGTFLYGMTSEGGANNYGTVFKIMPDGTGYLKLFDFAKTVSGKNPLGSLISDGTFLYGMTSEGGANNKGTVFKIKPDGTGYTKLLDFDGMANGMSPLGSLLSDGTFLYGMTSAGGTNNGLGIFNGIGVIFRIKPDGTGYTKLHDFENTANADGQAPRGSLISDGTFLYGMTSQGGTNNKGTIFKYQLGAVVVLQNLSENNPSISIYPNPFSIHATLQTAIVLKNATLTVCNLHGQVVKEIKNISGQTIMIFRNNLPSGLYFIHLTENNKVITTTKLIITD